jgi:hypothetical protein
MGTGGKLGETMQVKATVVAQGASADAAIDLLLDELKLEIAGKLTDEQKARFLAGALDIMVTIRMTQAGRIPSAQSAIWGHPREDKEG